MNISVIGLGKLGLPIAACFAKAGHSVVGVDTNRDHVEALGRGFCPIEETGLAELLKSLPQSHVGGEPALQFTTSIEDATWRNQMSFIVVPTPTDSDNTFSIRHVIEAVIRIGVTLRSQPARHVVVIVSTVMPGDTGGKIKTALEESSGLVVGKSVGLVYSPEFVALGSVIRDFTRPDLLLIGESDEVSGLVVEQCYARVSAPLGVFRTNFINAELAKIAVNTYVTTKITFANMLAELCETLPGANVDEVTLALGMDSRIGPRYLTGSVGYGGPCFPRDNRALTHLLVDRLGLRDTSLPECVDSMNDRFYRRILALIQRVREGRRVVVVGTTYKQGTAVEENSLGLFLLENLDMPREEYKGLVAIPDNAVVVLTLPVPFPEKSDWKGIVIDCWRSSPHLARLELEGVTYIPIGIGPEKL